MTTYLDLLEQGWKAIALAWREVKDIIELDIQVGNPALHVLAGLAVFGLVLLLGGKPPRWIAAWCATLVITLWNELVDITIERWPDVSEQLVEGGFDIAITMAIPTLILGLAIYPRMHAEERRRTGESSAQLPPGDDGMRAETNEHIKSG